jgi:hypothetical protein
MSHLSLPTYTMLSGNVAPPYFAPSTPSLPGPLESTVSPHSQLSTSSASHTEERTEDGPITDHYMELTTSHRGYFSDFTGRDPFTSQRHLILRCIRPPPTTLAVGSKVEVRGAQRELMRVHSVKRGQVRFVLGPYAPFATYTLLQVPQQYTELPWHWRARLQVGRLGREWT